jgi:hypothetical protein
VWAQLPTEVAAFLNLNGGFAMREEQRIKKTITQVELLALTIFWCFIPMDSAHAYLDPGSGSMLLQLLLGGVAGLAVVLKLYWAQFKDRIHKVFGSKRNQNEKDD